MRRMSLSRIVLVEVTLARLGGRPLDYGRCLVHRLPGHYDE